MQSTDTSLEELYGKFRPVADAGIKLPVLPVLPSEVGHFNVFNVADLMLNYRNRPPMTFHRRAFYKISLIRGKSRIEYADQAIDVSQEALWFSTPRIPYRWLPNDLDQTGYFCIFTEEFLRPARGIVVPDESPVFQPGGCPVMTISSDHYASIEVIFLKMVQEHTSGYAFKYDLLRIYLLELIHIGQKLQPAASLTPVHNASARVTALFVDLLERQFPLEFPQQRLQLRTANDFADRLAVHVNHLNRVLKETTGHTTTELISNRVAQEAKILLKQTNWTVSEIADCLGFADVAHFCRFFKRRTGLAPGSVRD
jgi:AraC-like DNA-binding protein